VAALRELAGGRADLLAEACGSWRARPRASCTSRWPARRVHQNRAPVRIEIPSARAEASAHVRSRSAWSSRHAARETRQHPPLPPGRLDPLTDRHSPSLPAAFRKLDAVAVLMARLLPALPTSRSGAPTVGTPRRNPIEAIGSSRLAAERSVSATDPVPAGELWHVRGLAWPWSARHPAFIEQLLTART
jgi:hypothetical protein